MDRPKVTVYLSTYNQQEYVAQALDSILMQKTTFSYEVLVADDCSTDDTQKIILEYQAQHPDLIQTYFTNPNVGGCKKLTNCIDMGLFRGEYLAYLEGDDYWLEEDRLQTLVDFLEEHPEYSRVSHKRLIIDASDSIIYGYDIDDDVLNKPFTIQDFLAGKNYSDFGSVFRNYFQDAGNKYHPLLLASRNVCDFQDMFITQDFGPVYVMDRCFGVYRFIRSEGATNYNSITTQSARCREHIRLAQAAEQFYNGKYDLSPMIQRYRHRLLGEAIKAQDSEAFTAAREYVPSETIRAFAPEFLYLALRGKRSKERAFILASLTPSECSGISVSVALYSAKRILRKLCRIKTDERIRGYCRG